MSHTPGYLDRIYVKSTMTPALPVTLESAQEALAAYEQYTAAQVRVLLGPWGQVHERRPASAC